MDMETRRKEAEMALDTAKSQGISFVRFQAAQMDALKVMLQSQKLTQSFCMESVGKLIEYDNKYETELVKTLKAYLLSPKDVAGICSRLNIHRNTFYKRLDKMKDILGNELSSAEDFMKIQLTLHLMNIE